MLSPPPPPPSPLLLMCCTPGRCRPAGRQGQAAALQPCGAHLLPGHLAGAVQQRAGPVRRHVPPVPSQPGGGASRAAAGGRSSSQGERPRGHSSSCRHARSGGPLPRAAPPSHPHAGAPGCSRRAWRRRRGACCARCSPRAATGRPGAPPHRRHSGRLSFEARALASDQPPKKNPTRSTASGSSSMFFHSAPRRLEKRMCHEMLMMGPPRPAPLFRCMPPCTSQFSPASARRHALSPALPALMFT